MDPVVSQEAPYYIPVAKPSVSTRELSAVHKALREEQLSGGRQVAEFEEEFALANGKAYGVACASGTLALELALRAAGATTGSLVVLPSLTMVAIANAVLAVNAYPVFLDSRASDGNVDPTALRAAERRYGPALKYWIIPHLYGAVAEVPEPENETTIIGDCAEAHYARATNGLPLGGTHHLSTYSYYSNKIVCCGEGGMVITDCPQQARLMKSLRAHAFTPGQHFHHQQYALGCRMTELQGAIGLTQHRRHQEFLTKREAIAQRYSEWFREINGKFITIPSRTAGSVWWVYPLLVDANAPIDRDQLRHRLAEAGIETRTYFYPLHRQKHLRKYAENDKVECPVADDLAARGLYLPLYPDLSSDKVDYIAECVLRAFH